jgi:hypothetical protein
MVQGSEQVHGFKEFISNRSCTARELVVGMVVQRLDNRNHFQLSNSTNNF